MVNYDEDEGDNERSTLLNPEQEKHPCCSTHPKSVSYQVTVCVLICFLSFGSYFCFDNPAALHSEFREDLEMTEVQFMNLYAWYSWPNVVLSFIGGFLIDKVFGVRLGASIFSLFLIAGQFVFAAGAFINAHWLCYLGRFIFGIGGESLAVAQNTYTVKWFSGSTLNLIFGLQLAMARIGSTVNMNVMQPLYKHCESFMSLGPHTLGMALLIAASTTVYSFICGAVLGFMDKRAEKINKRERGAVNETEDEEAKIQLTDILHFPIQFWLVTLICVLYYSAVFPFVAIAKPYFESEFGLSPSEAALLNSIIYIMSAPLSPCFGLLIDFVGFNASFIVLANGMCLAGHIILGFIPITPWVGVIIIGISYSMLASSLWPLVSLLVERHQLGTAYGFMQSWQNLGLAVIAIAAGAIAEKGWIKIELFFSGLVLGTLSAPSVYMFTESCFMLYFSIHNMCNWTLDSK